MANLDFAAFLISLLVLGIIIYFPWQQLCIDAARNQIFEARDKLFDLAVDGYIDLDDPGYINTREEYNNIIRFAHHISWPRLLVYKAVFQKYGKLTDSRKRRLPTSNNESVKKRISQIDRNVYHATIHLLFLRSPLLWVFYLGGLLWREFGGKPPKILRRLFDNIRTEANDFEGHEPQWTSVARAG